MIKNEHFRIVWISACGLACFATVGLARPPAWKTIKSDLGGFSIQMPGDPKPAITKGKETGETEAVSYMMEIAGGAIFVTSKPASPKANDTTVEQQLDMARTDFVSKAQRTLISEMEITLDGHTGRQLQIEQVGGFNSQVRFFIVENREIQVLALYRGKEMAPEMARFVKSFKLIKK